MFDIHSKITIQSLKSGINFVPAKVKRLSKLPPNEIPLYLFFDKLKENQESFEKFGEFFKYQNPSL